MNILAKSIHRIFIVSAVTSISITSVQNVQAQQNFSFASINTNKVSHHLVKTVAVPENSKVLTTVETEPVFEGGEQGWMQYLRTNIIYPETALAFDVCGYAEVTFTVDKNGAVTNVKAVSGEAEFQAEAERVMKLSSGKWKPANQNGFTIPFRHKQKISFHLATIQ